MITVTLYPFDARMVRRSLNFEQGLPFNTSLNARRDHLVPTKGKSEIQGAVNAMIRSSSSTSSQRASASRSACQNTGARPESNLTPPPRAFARTTPGYRGGCFSASRSWFVLQVRSRIGEQCGGHGLAHLLQPSLRWAALPLPFGAPGQSLLWNNRVEVVHD